MIDSLAPLLLIIGLGVIVWDIVLAGWIASRKEAPVLFTQLTGLCGLLVAPALVVALATGTEAGSRTISGIAWLLPAISCAFVVQVLYAIVVRLVSPVTGLPILLYDVAVAMVAIGDYLVTQRGSAPEGFQAAVASRDALVGMAVGRAALVTPFALLVPMVAPAYPARWRLSAVVRATLVLAATALTTVLALEWPRGLGAVRSYTSAVSAPIVSRSTEFFTVGMRLFPLLEGAPPARAVAADLALEKLIEPEIVLLVLDADATRIAPLDSISRVLESLRDKRVRIAVALAVEGQPSSRADLERLSALERVLTRIKPDVVFPALRSAVPSLLREKQPSAAWWQSIETRSAQVVERVRPRTELAWAASRLDATDSVVYAWAATPESPIRVIGASAFPSFSGLPAVNARLRAFERWHDQATSAGIAPRPHWLVSVGGLPHAHGDVAQLASIRRALSWGAERGWINAVIVGEPADYEGGLGLRASNGRQRAAVEDLAAIIRSKRSSSR